MAKKTEKPKVTADFFGDWVSGTKRRLQEMGYQVEAKSNDRDLLIRYFNVLKRLISPTPRTVLISQEFSCPSENQSGVDLIASKATKGEDLTPHLHTTIKTNPDYNDPLLNDWGIHHLHLGKTIQSDGFVERTGPVLFVRVTDDTFYMIDVLDHGIGHEPWVKRKLVDILHKNWPASISQFKLKGIVSTEFNPTEKEIGKFRNARVLVSLQLDDGTIYASIGGGYATSGKSIDAVSGVNHYTYLIRYIESYVKEHAVELMNQFKDVVIGHSLDFHFAEIRGNEIYVLERNNKVVIKLELQN